MASDDDDTPRVRPRRPGSHWGDDERAKVGRDQRQRTPASSPTGIPIVDPIVRELGPDDSDGTPAGDSDGITSPVELLARDLSDRELEIVKLLRDSPRIKGPDLEGPVPYSQLIKLIARIDNLKLDERKHNLDRANQVLEVAGKKLPPEKRLEKIEGRVRILWAAAVLAVTAAGGSVITVAHGLYDRGESVGEDKIRIEHLERDVQQNRQDIYDLLGRSGSHRYQPDRAGFLSPPVADPPPKGNTP